MRGVVQDVFLRTMVMIGPGVVVAGTTRHEEGQRRRP